MIQNVLIDNFQSHKSTNMELSSSINVIQGNSDCGKSAVMRALCWLLFNPAGDYFVSDWARKGKTMTAPCEVTVEVDGHKVTRRRDKDFNGYVLDGEAFEATRNSVPPRVLKVLGMSEVNVQRQLDAPFLLSKSPGEVSRYINGLVDLQRIDEWVSAVNSRYRSLSQKAENASVRMEEARAEAEKYEFVNDLEPLSLELERIASESKSLSDYVKQLSSELDEYGRLSDTLKGLPDVNKLFTLLREAESIFMERGLNDNETGSLKSDIESYESALHDKDAVPDVDLITKTLSEAESVRHSALSLTSEIAEVRNGLKRFDEAALVHVPDELFAIIERLERYSGVKSRMESSVMEMRQSLGTYSSNSLLAEVSSKELSDVESVLSTMVCPLCGRRGIHEEER